MAVSPILVRMQLPRLLPALEPRELPRDADSRKVARIIRYTDALTFSRLPLLRRSCMHRAVTLYYFLRREGVDLSVHFGVARVDQDLGGHCWLMKDGEPYLENEDPRRTFTPMYVFPESERSLTVT